MSIASQLRARIAKFCARKHPFSPRLHSCASIERLEQRIAPAILVNAKNISFQDIDGDQVTLTISKGLFKTATINSVLKFDTGKVNGNDNTAQQLQLIDLTRLSAASVKGLSIAIDAVAAGGGDGFVDVGFIDAKHRDLASVTIDGDLGGLSAGDKDEATPGLQSLVVDSLGDSGLATQRPGGSLETKVRGILGTLAVTRNIAGATVGAAGQVGTGTIGSVNVGGDLIGGAAPFSGSIRATGPIGSVVIGGDILGGSGADSGLIGTATTLSSVTVNGSIVGGSGARSGSLRATSDIGAVVVSGGVTGGGGVESGVVGAAGQIASVTIGESLIGGTSARAGTILSTGGIGDVLIGGDVLSGSGTEAGAIGTDGLLGTVTINGRLTGSVLSTANIASVIVVKEIAGASIRAFGDIGPIFANASMTAAAGISATVINAGGDIGVITAAGNLAQSVIVAGFHVGPALTIAQAGKSPAALGFESFPGGGRGAGSVGALALTSVGGAPATIQSTSVIAGVTGAGGDGEFGTVDDRTGAGSGIGGIAAGGGVVDSFLESGTIGITSIATGQIARTEYLATDSAGAGIGALNVANVDEGTAAANTAITSSRFHSATGIGSVTASTLDTSFGSNGIFDSDFRATGGGIASIAAITFDPSPIDPANGTAGAIVKSAFNARDAIGTINTRGHLQSSIFIAGVDLGTNFATSFANAGSFNNAAAADFGFPGASNGTTATIGTINVGGTRTGQIAGSTFLAGVTGPGADGKFGTLDDATVANAAIGNISAPGGIRLSTFESGTIGQTAIVDGTLTTAVYRATDATAAGIGDVTVGINSTQDEQLINGTTLESSAAIGNIVATLNTSAAGLSNGITNSSFLADGAIGNLTVIVTVNGAPDSNAISNLTVKAGRNGGTGGIGTIDAAVSGNVFGSLGTAGINNSTFDAGNGNIAGVIASSDGSPGLRQTIFRAHGDIGAILSGGADATFAMDATTISAFGNIGNVDAAGDVLGGKILAGYDIGSDLTFGNESLLATSNALSQGRSIGRVDITGIVTGDIIASVNPGNGYVFGDANDANAGAGGAIGLISVQMNTRSPLPDGVAPHAIEAATIADADTTPTTPGIQITVNGFLATLPLVLDNGAPPDNVRVRVL